MQGCLAMVVICIDPTNVSQLMLHKNPAQMTSVYFRSAHQSIGESFQIFCLENICIKIEFVNKLN